MTAVLTILAFGTAILGNAHATSSSYSFNLAGPNTAMAPNTIPGTPIAAGDVLRLTGSGTFDASAGSATGGGSFTHYKTDEFRIRPRNMGRYRTPELLVLRRP